MVQDAIEKADLLIEAMGWIRQFRDKITVIKLGGSVMEDPDALRHLLVDIVFMETVGMRPIVVHGGGAAITRAMAEAKIEPRFIQGRRYTDDATLTIVERVLAGEINENIAARIEEFGGRAMPLNFAGETEQQRAVRRTADAHGRRRQADRLGARRPSDARRSRHDRQLVLRRTGAGDSVDVRNGDRRTAERERRHGGHGRGPGAGRREAGFFERRERRAAGEGTIPIR